MRRVPIIFLLVATVAAPCAAWAAPAAPLGTERASAVIRSLVRLQGDVGNLVNSLAPARSDVASMVALGREFPLERRLLDADLFFETKDYDRASTLYRDLVDNPAFRSSPGFYRAVRKLGDSLFLLRNYRSARTYLEQAAVPMAGAEFNPAIARLFEIAVLTRDYAQADRFESLAATGVLPPETLYSYAKYLFHRGRRVQSAEVFARVPAGSGPYARAVYFLGVIEAGSKRLESALDRFSVAAIQPVRDDADREVQAQATLSKARMQYELGRFQDALATFQEIDPKSGAFLDSLFDLAWTYLKVDEPARAEHALDILLMSAPPGELQLKASALRGRILSRLNDNAGAAEAYQEVSDTLSPVANELESIAREPKNLAAYFDWIIERDNASFKLDVPISDRTARWLESDADMASLVGMFSDLSRERDDLRASFDIVEKLLWALRSGGKLEAFPNLKEKYLRLKATQGRFLANALEAADLAFGVLPGNLIADRESAYQVAVKARNEAGARFRKGPRTYEDFLKLEKTKGDENRDVEKQIFLVESMLDIERHQVLAIEEWLRDKKASDSAPLGAEREVQVMADLAAMKALLNELHQEMLRLRDQSERETLAGIGRFESTVMEDDGRKALVVALRREVAVLQSVGTGPASPAADVARTAASVIERAVEGLELVDPVARDVMNIATRGAGEFVVVIEREKNRLAASIADVHKAELDAKAFAQSEGAAVFRSVKNRLGDVLLEADLGLVDMAWQREQSVSERLRYVGTERGKKLKDLHQLEEQLKGLQDPKIDEKPQVSAPSVKAE